MFSIKHVFFCPLGKRAFTNLQNLGLHGNDGTSTALVYVPLHRKTLWTEIRQHRGLGVHYNRSAVVHYDVLPRLHGNSSRSGYSAILPRVIRFVELLFCIYVSRFVQRIFLLNCWLSYGFVFQVLIFTFFVDWVLFAFMKSKCLFKRLLFTFFQAKYYFITHTIIRSGFGFLGYFYINYQYGFKLKQIKYL